MHLLIYNRANDNPKTARDDEMEIEKIDRRAGRMYFDSHLHSMRSQDGRDSLELICRCAVSRGLDGIALTDHCDIDEGHAYCERVLGGARQDVAMMREKYDGRLRISLGVELAEIHHDLPLAQTITSCPDVDFVLGSLHRLRGHSDFYYIDYDSIDRDALIDAYYDELLETAELGDIDSMAHINYQVRYMSENARKKTDFNSHIDRLEPVLQKLAERGRGIELNTSAGKRFDQLVPSFDVLVRFRELGGEVVTVGSDAHRAHIVGHRANDALDVLARAGFRYAAFFSRRKPEFYKI